MALPKRGIDISEFNGSVDIAALQGQVDFVIIRCGYGSDYANQDDPQFEANVKKCQAAGIPWGTYLYSYAKTKAMAQSEAAHTLRLLQGRRPPYGVWYDAEDSSLPSGEALIDNVVAYCQARAVLRGVRLPLLVGGAAEQPPAGQVRQVGGPVEQPAGLPGPCGPVAVHRQADAKRQGL